MLIKGFQKKGVAWALQRLPKLILLLIGLSYVPLLQGQSSGQWGICEFSTLSALNSFDPSSNNWDCKIAHCQADSKYYYWDGDSWEEMILQNVYTHDGSLSGNRSLSLNGYDLNIDVADDASTQLQIDNDYLTIGRDPVAISNTFISSRATLTFSVDNNKNSTSDFFVWGSDGSPDLGSNDSDFSEWMRLSNNGLRLSLYGSGTYTGTATQILGVDSDGDVIEISASSLDTYLGGFDQTLTGARIVNLNGNELTFDATVDIVMEPTGELGIGTADPNSPLHIYEATGTGPSGSDASILLEHGDSGGSSSIVFKSRVNNNSDYGYISFSDDGSGNGSNNENALLTIGVENDGVNANQDDIALMPTGYVGIGTTSPGAKLDVDGGSLKLSDYGTGSKTGSATYGLAVDADGDVIETNTSKSSQTFYPPALAIDASSTGTDLTLDLHQEYVNRFGSPAVKSSSAPSAIPYYSESELYYYVTDYDTAVFANLSISDAGVLTYDIIASPADDYSLINVVFVVK